MHVGDASLGRCASSLDGLRLGRAGGRGASAGAFPSGASGRGTSVLSGAGWFILGCFTGRRLGRTHVGFAKRTPLQRGWDGCVASSGAWPPRCDDWEERRGWERSAPAALGPGVGLRNEPYERDGDASAKRTLQARRRAGFAKRTPRMRRRAGFAKRTLRTGRRAGFAKRTLRTGRRGGAELD